MPQDKKRDKMLCDNEIERDSFLSLSHEQMKELLDKNRRRVEQERKEFLDAYFSAGHHSIK